MRERATMRMRDRERDRERKRERERERENFDSRRVIDKVFYYSYYIYKVF